MNERDKMRGAEPPRCCVPDFGAWFMYNVELLRRRHLQGALDCKDAAMKGCLRRGETMTVEEVARHQKAIETGREALRVALQEFCERTATALASSAYHLPEEIEQALQEATRTQALQVN